MTQALQFFAVAFTALFVVVEPLGIVPIFASLTEGRPESEVRQTALRATVVGSGILFLFAFLGPSLLSALGVRVDAFRVAGGLLLLLTALDMLRAKAAPTRRTTVEVDDASHKEDIAVVPLAIPLLAGPGAMATVMMLMSRAAGAADMAMVLLAVSATFVASYFILRSATLIHRVLGASVMAVVERVLGLVLAAMAIQFMVDGGTNLLQR